MTDQVLIKKYKEKYGAKWFDEFSLNTIVIEREPGQFAFYDVEKDDQDLVHWINKMSLKKTGDEINRETFAIAKDLGQPICYLYYDL